MDFLSRFVTRGLGRRKRGTVVRHVVQETTQITPGHIIPWVLVAGGLLLLVSGKKG